MLFLLRRAGRRAERTQPVTATGPSEGEIEGIVLVRVVLELYAVLLRKQSSGSCLARPIGVAWLARPPCFAWPHLLISPIVG